jgi:hypothetical protein
MRGMIIASRCCADVIRVAAEQCAVQLLDDDDDDDDAVLL